MNPTVAMQVLEEIHALGIHVRADRESIQFRPKKAMPPELAERARACRAELLELLAPNPPRPDRVLLDGRECEIIWFDQIGKPLHSFCSDCGLKRWWFLCGEQSPARPWVCGHCSPPSLPDALIEGGGPKR